MLRDQLPIPLDEQRAPDSRCHPSVPAPPTVRQGIAVSLSRNRQSAALHGVVYVSPVGDRR